jgi:membrane fusion protein (multidrug efflux system)
MTDEPDPLTTPGPAPAAAPKKPARRRRGAVLLLLLALAGGGAVWYWSGLDEESTDDAFLAADVFQINAKVAGRVATVHVLDNQDVAANELLAELDAADYEQRLAAARADLRLAQAQLEEATLQVGWTDAATTSSLAEAAAGEAAAQARLQQENANLDAARAEAARTAADRDRYQKLSEHAVSRQRLDEIVAAATTAESGLQAAQKRVGSATADVAAAGARSAFARADRARVPIAEAVVARRRAEVQSAEAAVGTAELQLKDTRIIAPAAGRVTRKAVLAGTYVQPGQALMALVGVDLWVVANFKETQLRRLRPGQRALVHVDACAAAFPAHVDSIQAGSGAVFSLLPPENATGNFVKVVQRVPVKLRFETPIDRARWALGPGMSVVPVVQLR